MPFEPSALCPVGATSGTWGSSCSIERSASSMLLVSHDITVLFRLVEQDQGASNKSYTDSLFVCLLATATRRSAEIFFVSPARTKISEFFVGKDFF